MKSYRAKGDAKSFLCAAGVLSHYVGDACQPLHISMHSDGLNGASTGVHSVYEEKMVDKYAAEIGQMLEQFDYKTLGQPPVPISSGYEAAQASIELMRRTCKRLPPKNICQTFNDLGGGSSQPVAKGLWEKFSDETLSCLADGTRILAMLWESAFAANKQGDHPEP